MKKSGFTNEDFIKLNNDHFILMTKLHNELNIAMTKLKFDMEKNFEWTDEMKIKFWDFAAKDKFHPTVCMLFGRFEQIHSRAEAKESAEKKRFLTEDGFYLRHYDVIYCVDSNFKILNLVHDQYEWEKRGDVTEYKTFKVRDNAVAYVMNSKLPLTPKECFKYPEGIISFQYGGGISLYPFAKDNRGYALYNDWVDFNVREEHKILSVKNSSGEILTIGDETNFGTITKFKLKIEDNMTDMTLWAYSPSCGIASVNVFHPKKKTFTTLDGEEFCFGETIYVVNINDWSVKKMTINEQYLFPYEKMLSRKEAAEKYIEDNKPRFSKKQFQDALNVITQQGGSLSSLIEMLK